MSGSKAGEKEEMGWVGKEAIKAKIYLELAEDARFWKEKEKQKEFLAEKRSLSRANYLKEKKDRFSKAWARRYDKVLANLQDKDLARMYDMVLANRLDEALYKNYAENRDQWCSERFDLTMEYLNESIRAQEAIQRADARKRRFKLVSISGLVIALILSILIYFNKTLPQKLDEESRNMGAEAKQLMGEQNFQAAIDKYSSAIKKTPKLSSLYNGLATAYLEVGERKAKENKRKEAIENFEKSRDSYNQCIKNDEDNIEALNGLSSVYLKLKDWEMAKDTFQKVIDKDPGNIAALNGLAAVLALEQNYDEAIKRYKEACENIKKSPVMNHFIIASKGIGDMSAEMGKYEEALNSYEKVYNLNPNDPSTLNKMGYVYTKGATSGKIIDPQYKKAVNHYEKAINIYKTSGIDSPDIPDTYNGLGSVYTKAGQFDKAIEYYQRSIEYYKQTPDDQKMKMAIVYNGMGSALLGKKDYSGAKENFQNAIDNISDQQKASMFEGLIYAGKGYALQGLGQTDEAKVAFEKACAADGNVFEIFNQNNNIDLDQAIDIETLDCPRQHQGITISKVE
ncbi:MAG: tetratricopeptide repeat protein [Desulfobacteraceae bacterium]|nr:tetratricopeptide repeat protein [Desulfobacteraceae bacterium]